jgi:hypothetical protein
MKFLFLLPILFFSCSAHALLVVVDADDFVEGSILTNSCKYATLSTTNGGDIYASKLSPNAANGNNTLEVGHQIFGSKNHQEWFSDPSLQITFNAKTTRFSILVAELYFDAGPGSEPLTAMVYDEFGNFLSYLATDDSTQVKLGEIEPGVPEHGYWAYWKLEFSAPSIGKVILGGDSEPTIFDRLEFDCVEAEVTEPSTFALLLLGMIAVGFRTKNQTKRNL